MDKVRPVKWETDSDGFPTELDPNEDAISVNGIYVQDTESDDIDVLISRDSEGKLKFKDKDGGTYSLTQLASGGMDLNDILIDDVTGNIVTDDIDGTVVVSG